MRNAPVWKNENLTEIQFEDSVSALCSRGLDFKTLALPFAAKLPDGTYLDVEGSRALVRGVMKGDPNRRYIATVSEQYEPIQHIQFAEMLQRFPKEYPLEMIASAGRWNQRVMFGYNFGTYAVAGFDSEQIKHWVYVDNCNDGGSSIHMMEVPIRMYCLNQEARARKEASFNININIKHGQQGLVDAEQWMRYLVQIRHSVDVEHEIFDRMARTSIAPSLGDSIVGVAREVLTQVYAAAKPRLVHQYGETPNSSLPDPVRRAQAAYAAELQRMEVYRVNAMESFEKFNDEFPHVGGTQWALYNAVTEQENWRPAGRGTGSNELASVLMGDRAATMSKAYSLILATN